MITYVFPPAALVGAHRALKYCRYLGRYQWTPVVLTARTTSVRFTDEDLLGQLPSNVKVYRTLDIDPAKWEEKLAERKLRRKNKVASTGVSRNQSSSPAFGKPGTPSGYMSSLRGALKALLKNSPDSHVFWVPFALFRGALILLTRRIDVIYCTSPPHSSHIAAFLLGKCFRKPYVLDFRDPWYVLGSVRIPSGKFKWLLKWETRVKRRIVGYAAHVICVSRGERDEMRAEYPELHADHFSCITNGYDPADSVQETLTPRFSDKLIMTHAGTIYAGVAEELFRALEQLLSSEPALPDKLEVRLLGEVASEYADAIRRLEQAGIVRSYGLVPHAETLCMIRDSDVLLILMGGRTFNSSHLPSKTFEYLQAEKLILAIAADGELSDILKRSGLGLVVLPESVEELAARVRELCDLRRSGPIKRPVDRAFISAFERPELARQLAVVLDRVAQSGSVEVKRV